MEAAKKTRAALRSSFTKLKNKLIAYLEAEEPERAEVEAQFNVLQVKYKALIESEEELRTLLSNTDEDLEEEIEACDEYMYQFARLEVKVRDSLRYAEGVDDRNSQISCSDVPTQRRRYKLPKLELKKFQGELNEWLPFWSQFEKIDSDLQLDEADKFQYLVQSTVIGSRARMLVESFPATADNYKLAINALKSRYGRDDLLVEVYVRELLNLVLSRSGANNMSLPVLYDKLECQLRALETLQVTTDKCAAMLLPLVESSLPDDILRLWQRNHSLAVNASKDKEYTPKDRLEGLMRFIGSEVENEQKIALARSGFAKKEVLDDKKHRHQAREELSKGIATAASLLTQCEEDKKQEFCVFCAQKHKSSKCANAESMSNDEKVRILAGKGRCFACFGGGHNARRCFRRPKCTKCGGGHYLIMCRKDIVSSKPAEVTNKALASSTNAEVFLQTFLVKVGKTDGLVLRAILDSAAQKSYILSDVADKLHLVPKYSEKRQHSLFGGSVTELKSHKVFEVDIGDINGDYECTVEVLGQDKICDSIVPIYAGFWTKEMDRLGIKVNDKNGPVELLIGADIMGRLLTGRHHVLECGLVAVETSLGWTLMGKIPGERKNVSAAMMTVSMLTTGREISDLWNLESLGIRDSAEIISEKERVDGAQDHFLKTVRILDDCRYEVKMPWRVGHPPLPTNKELAEKRLRATQKKLNDQGIFNEYEAILNDWEKDGIIEVVADDGIGGASHYLPHRAVVKEGSTTKIRPVFDASAHEKGNPSLNMCLEKGCNLIETIPSILARFRTEPIGVISDIRKAFLQIGLSPSDRQYVRFLWKDSNGKERIYQHCRVIFGVNCSPFLLGAVLNHHLQKVLENCEDASFSRDLVLKLKESFYVDNCVTSVQNETALKRFIDESTRILALRRFDLRGWEFAGSNLAPSTKEPVNVLGLDWNTVEDVLQVQLPEAEELMPEVLTKRQLLSASHRIFDPLGIVSCVMVGPKQLLQEACAKKIGWDDEVGADLQKRFNQWASELSFLSQVRVPRYLCSSDEGAKLSLHVFCDASQTSYATVIFLRVKVKERVSLRFVMAKSRLSPMSTPTSRKITIPRLELMAATIGARLCANVKQDLRLQGVETFLWTDSSTVLAWILRNDNWNVFVNNRVQEIRKNTDGCVWKHIPGTFNPADLPSRGCSPSHFVQSKWWEGPHWLQQPSDQWPTSGVNYDEQEIASEEKRTLCSALVAVESESDWYHRDVSDYDKILRRIAWIYRFINNCRSVKEDRNKSRDLHNLEVEHAEKMVFRWVQAESFNGIEDNKIKCQAPFMDSEGLIRFRTKVSSRNDTHDFCHPIVLPNSKHPFVAKLIRNVHVKSQHAGVQVLMSLLRERFWILQTRQSVKRVVSKCVVCKRFVSKSFESVPAPLLENRVRDAKVFEVIGVDLAGPLYLRKDSQKVWICLYTCAVYRAVHLELLSALSTDNFLLGLRRFISRRGRPSIVYCDNGTNFVGASNELKRLDSRVLVKYGIAKKIEFRFIPPASPWWGGWWERLVGLTKDLLKRTLGHSVLDFEELQTLLCDCEAIINSRPLTQVSEQSSDLVPLTPSMFLSEIPEIGVPDLDALENLSFGRRYRYRQKLRDDLRHRFRKEYLGQLAYHTKKLPLRNIVVGEIVFVGSDNSKRIDWPLAIVEELIPGKDGNVRLARLKTATGVILRPVQRLFPLELKRASEELSFGHVASDELVEAEDCLAETEDRSTDVSAVKVTSRSGRRIVAPLKLDI